MVEDVTVLKSLSGSQLTNVELYSGVCTRREGLARKIYGDGVAYVYHERTGESQAGIVHIYAYEGHAAVCIDLDSVEVGFELYPSDDDNSAVNADGIGS